MIKSVLIGLILLVGLVWAQSTPFDYTRQIGTTNNDGYLDRVTGGTRDITTDHSLLHDKRAYSVYLDSNAVAASGSISFAFVTADTPTYVHFKRYETFATSARATFTFTEAVVCSSCTTGATTISNINRNRVSTIRASQVTVYKNPNTTGGTVIEKAPTGNGGTGSGTTANDRPMDIEFVLKPSTAYLLKVVNNDGQAKDLGIWAFWYEEGRY